MKKVLFFTLIFIISFSSFNCKPKEKTDLLVFNGKIYTVDSVFTIAEAMCIKDGKVVKVGSHKELSDNYTFTNELDIQGRFVYPGLIDAHCHLYGYALSLRQADLKGAKSFDDVLNRMNEHTEKHPRAEWIIGRGWDQNMWKVKSFPTKDKLDKIFPEKPVLLTRIDGHAALLNQKALDEAGFDKKTKIPGGVLEIKNNKLTGIVLDKACDSVRTIVPLPQKKELTQLFMKAQKNCFEVGLTSIADAGLDKEIIEFIQSMQENGKLKMRIYAMLNPTKENFETYIKKGIYKTDYLHLHSIKLYADGALGSRGAALLLPYSDAPKNHGIIIETQEYYNKIAEEAIKYSYQLNTHAIGDSAVRMMLDIYGKHLKEKNDLRWRIEHSQIVHPGDISKYGEYSIIPAVNTTHATSDMFWAIDRLGKTRIKHAYAYHDLLEQNGWLCNGSDFPIESINPLYGFYAGTARKNLDGEPQSGFQTQNRLSRLQALKAMTIWAARACFEEDVKGSLAPGKFADFVILDNDIMQINLSKIPNIKVLRTFIAGKEVFKK